MTECLEGESLRARLGAGALSVDEALDVALQVARGLGAAHARGIVHRDLKPENIFLALDGRVKILDFGLATLHDATRPAPPSPELPAGTTPPLVAGTAGYMAPEQVRGEVVDGRADIFALGAVLYEMLAGRRPFKGDSTLGTLDAVLTLQPPDLSESAGRCRPPCRSIVRRCLAKSPDDRFATVADLVSALDSVIRARNVPPPPSLLALLRRPVVMVTVMLAILAMAAGGWRWRVVTSRARWARTVAAPEVQRLLNHGDYVEAFLLARQALDVLPDDRHLYQLWLDVSIPAVVTTDPAGADVAFAPYRTPTTSWFSLGRTPLNGVRIPRSLFRVRISKAGFQTIEGSGPPPALRYRLDPVSAVPPGMVRVAGDRDPVRLGLVGEVDDFWIDRFEVTNRQFKEFVDRGGYGRREYLAGAVRRRRTVRAVGRRRRAISRRHRTAGAGDVEVWNVSRRSGGVSGRRRELVRGVGLRGVRRQEPAHDPSLVPCGGPGALRGHPDGQQLRRKGPGAGRQSRRPGPVRHLRHGGQREGMVLDRDEPPPIPPGWRMERADGHVRGLRCQGAVRAGAGLRLPSREVQPAAAARRGRPRPDRGARS